MAKSRRVISRQIWAFLLVGFALAVGLTIYRNSHPAKTTGIFQIEPASLNYGNTTVTGTLLKDAPVGEPGTFLLVLPDSRPITLDVQDLDGLLGETLAVSGRLLPAVSDSTPMSMTVSSITTQ